MNKHSSKKQQLQDDLVRLSKACRLDSWTAFVNEMTVPADIYPALASGRPELIKIIQPRELNAAEAKALFDIVGTLIETNMALREHAERLAQFTDTWADSFKQLRSLGTRINQFANFDHEGAAEEEPSDA